MENMNKYVKFTGKFTDLIPDGWTFCKLFARNYRQYSKTCDGEQHSQNCRIWQHLGGYLEIEDLFDLSAVIVQKIADGKINEWGSLTKSFYSDKMETVYWFVIDKTNGVFYPYHSEEQRQIQRKLWSMQEKNQKRQIPQEEYSAWAKEHYNRYREFNMRPELITMIQDLLNKGWIKVVDDDRKEKYKY